MLILLPETIPFRLFIHNLTHIYISFRGNVNILLILSKYSK